MAIYITQGRYTGAAIKGLLAKPEDREKEVRALVERAGGKLLGYYITFGEYDWMTISEVADPLAVMGIVATAGATGTVSDVKTTLAFSGADAQKALAMAAANSQAFRGAGT